MRGKSNQTESGTKHVIINADDFGLTEAANRGILRAHLEGVLTSTSLMANGTAAAQAMEIAHNHPELGIGVHIVLVEEKPLSSPEQVPTLISEGNRMHKNYLKFLLRLMSGMINLSEVEREIRAQIEFVLGKGIEPSHIDSHQHLHVFPSLLKLVLRLAEEYHIPFIRHSYDATPQSAWGQKGLAFLAKRGLKKIEKSRVNRADYFLGAGYSGRLTENILLGILENIPPGISEIMCHPADESKPASSAYTHWNFMWQKELEALLAASVKAKIQEKEIILTNYKKLKGQHI